MVNMQSLTCCLKGLWLLTDSLKVDAYSVVQEAKENHKEKMAVKNPGGYYLSQSVWAMRWSHNAKIWLAYIRSVDWQCFQ